MPETDKQAGDGSFFSHSFSLEPFFEYGLDHHYRLGTFAGTTHSDTKDIAGRRGRGAKLEAFKRVPNRTQIFDKIPRLLGDVAKQLTRW